MADISDLPSVKNQVIDVVKEAGDLLLSFYGRKMSHRSKGGVDFATEADDAIDTFLREQLSSLFPQTQFLTEETAPSDYRSLKDTENLWVIDPIDGTANFSRGLEPFCISLALVSKGHPILGVIYEPTKKLLYHATIESDAYVNEKKLTVSNVSSLKEAYIVTGLPWAEDKRKEVYRLMEKMYLKVRSLGIRGSAAQDLCELAKGTIDGFFITGVKPWDIAAGSLFVLKAGGNISSLNGGLWNVFDSDCFFSNEYLYEQMRELLS